MPQLKKVVLAVGNKLVYADNYDQAREMLALGSSAAATPAPQSPASSQQTTTLPAARQMTTGDPRIDSVRRHLQRYRDFASQGKWGEAGKELDALQSEVQK